MIWFTPSRRVSYIALLAVVIAPIAIVYRRFEGNDSIALAVGLLAIVLGIVTIALFYAEYRQQYQKILQGSVRHGRLARRGRIIAAAGVVVVLGSFAWLAAVIAILGASPHHLMFFQIWLILFLIGCVLLFYPVVIKWAIAFGLIRFDDRE